jgi:hypothetical protein
MERRERETGEGVAKRQERGDKRETCGWYTLW